MYAGKLVLITGGSSGIGLALAEGFLRRDARVLVVGHRPEPLERAEAALRSVSRQVHALRCDIGDHADVVALGEAVLARHGCPDIVINNAGFATYRTFEQSSLDEVEALASVNFLGALRCTRVFLPGMVARREGTVVNVASIAGRMIITPNAVYGAAKHGMVAWSEAVRLELRRFGVRVLVVCPGRVETPFFEHETFQRRRERAETRYTVPMEQVVAGTFEAIESGRFLTYLPRTLGAMAWLLNAAPWLAKPLYQRLLLSRIDTLYADSGEPERAVFAGRAAARPLG